MNEPTCRDRIFDPEEQKDVIALENDSFFNPTKGKLIGREQLKTNGCPAKWHGDRYIIQYEGDLSQKNGDRTVDYKDKKIYIQKDEFVIDK